MENNIFSAMNLVKMRRRKDLNPFVNARHLNSYHMFADVCFMIYCFVLFCLQYHSNNLNLFVICIYLFFYFQVCYFMVQISNLKETIKNLNLQSEKKANFIYIIEMKKNNSTKTDLQIAGIFDINFFPSFFLSPFQTVQFQKFLYYYNSRYSFDSIHAYVVKSNSIFCQFNSAQSEKDMDFKMAITITNSPFKFENS